MPTSSAALVMLPPWRWSACWRKSRSKLSTTRSFASRKVSAGRRAADAWSCRRGRAEEVGRRDLGTGSEEQGLLDRGAQLAHVALPRVDEAGAQRVARERLQPRGRSAGGACREVVDEQRDVPSALGERRDHELDTRIR
jgi:hypothetical protein